ncbi:site-specific DNA-methyltransferase [Helicobacter pylori]|uniref:site-specific DNA-methyltransferase n=1 Tax=Helicobacter pylori TaxID=210 RepID=UPI0019337395|nr:site-specific DNA-methyltransferase [Helicobacter pylori]MBM0622304.1 site-specific DNA-methyltransferase [Helicobacter pylori]MBM0623868.1 site-specific DNA-methyltransferase [Helicobacter pylori]
MKTNEAQFYEVLENLFIGVKIEDQQENLLDHTPRALKNGMINLMKAKSQYYHHKKQELEKFIDLKCQDNNDLKEELFDKLYSFFKRYFSANGGIYFNDTPLYDSLYTKSDYEKCSLKKDTALFYKTKDLYYVKSETNYKDFCFELEGILFNFDTSSLESKKYNEKVDLVFDLKDTDTKTNTLNFSVTLSSKGTQTKTNEILKECSNQGVKLDEEILKKAFVKFKKQGSMDYFIHKNALGFLKEQLDLYLFEYLFKEMTEFDDKRLNSINTIKEVALQVISLVSEFENELCKIWNKPRFVLNSHFIVSLDKLKAKNYDLNKITSHPNYPKQVKEWQDLNLKITDNLLENEFLPLDTIYFKDLEEGIKNLFNEDEINGTLIKSENYQALNSLKNRYKEAIDCIYIDPPYNTQNNEFIYADNFKRSSWLSMMDNRLELAHKLLNNKGVMFVSIDDNEQAYLKTLMDEVFNGGGGGDNFVNCLAVKRGTKSLNSQFNQIKSLNVAFEYILVYKKSNNFYYVNPYVKDANEKQKEGIWAGLYSNMDRPTMRYEIDGVNIAKGQWKWSKEKGLKALQNYKDFLNSNFDNLKKYYEHHKSLGNELDFIRKNNHNTIEYWVKPREKLIVDTNFMDLHTSGTSEIKELFEGQALFDTPKPEALLKRIIEISTQENDLVLDFFAGSGTTCAVAHKLKRKYIGIEMGEHFDSVILPRLKKVISGFKSGALKEFNKGGVIKVYELESYEEILRKIKYEDNDKPLAYDEQYSDLVERKNESYTLNIEALEKMGVDIKETLENLWGLKVEFFNERVVKFKGNDKEIEILKALKEALIW